MFERRKNDILLIIWRMCLFYSMNITVKKFEII